MPATDEEQTTAHNPTSAQGTNAAQTKTSFPYENLEEVIRLAETIRNKGGTSCELSQLAAWLGTTRSSSKFRGQVSAAKMFGLIESRNKLASLTELGTAIVDPQQQNWAKVEAFLEVPLYRKLHDKFAGQLLPPDTGLEAEMCALGVTDRSVSKARQAFQRSASSAGFFAAGRDRLVRPATSDHGPESDATEAPEELPPATSPDPQKREQLGPSDPLLTGLWSKLPSEGPFSPSQRSQWLELAKLALNLVYGEENEDDGHPAVIDPVTPTNPEGSIRSGQPL